jgi:probable HAF family extracellular repeat protein
MMSALITLMYLVCASAARSPQAEAANSASVFPHAYVIKPLVGMEGLNYSQPTAINNHGDIVGTVSNYSPNPSVAGCTWSPIDLCPKRIYYGGVGTIWAQGINDASSIVGSSWRCAFVAVGEQATIITSDRLGYAINSHNEIVIEHSLQREGELYHVETWRDGKITSLPTLGGSMTYARSPHAINDHGIVVGTSDDRTEDPHAVMWRNGKIIELGIPGSTASEAVAINQSDEVVGWFTDTHKNHLLFLYRDGHASEIRMSIQDGPAEPIDINGQGVILLSAGPSSRLYLWHNGITVDVAARITNGKGWDNLSAVAMNDRGEIVGTGRHDGVSTGFALIPQ